ncbi:hypothetical protein BT93_C0562 [Corymbia citriodora subsp. variegata]|nr:hypothetical protein BT93_C0562 [Corymbia citriodora subsp. variegata]
MPRPTSSPPHVHFFFPFFFYIPCLVFLCSFSHVAESQIQDQELQVLLQLKQSWQDPSSLAHWVPSNSSFHCTWPGITCQDGSITELNLVNLNLNYSIPPFICDLKNLTKLNVSNNQIPGEFPTVLYNCSKLVYLDLSQNYFEGPIPSDIDRMADLQVLILATNSFSFHVPVLISRLRGLRILHLYQSKYNGTYPEEIFHLSDLEELRLEYNKFVPSQLPQDFTALKKLRFFSMAQTNLFGGIPETVSDIEALEVLDLGMNLLNGEIPGNIFTLRNLSEIYERMTNVSRSIPQAVSAANLRVIDLSNNNLTGNIPEDFGKLKTLSKLNLENNQFSPEDIGRLPALSDVRLSNNNLSGTIPPDFGKFSPLRRFEVAFNNLTSTLPKQLCHGGMLFGLAAPFQSLNFTESDIRSGLKEENVIGKGGSGKVYRIDVNHSGDAVAVKSIFNNQKLDKKLEKQFVAEVEILGNIRHLNIIKLLCCISCEYVKLLVYEYMENSSLDHWIHKKKRSSPVPGVANNTILDWPKRMRIALGAAKGLCYMHNDCRRPILHRDVKSSNILLDSVQRKNCRLQPCKDAARSSYYCDRCCRYLRYARKGRANEKIDVYSFGVVLLELTTGRKADDGNEDMGLAGWAWYHIQNGEPISDAIDEEIKDDSYLDEISNVYMLGIVCTGEQPSTRPTMKEVVQILLKCSDPRYDVKKKFRHRLEAAPLLGNSKNEEMPRSDSYFVKGNTY